MGRVKRVLKVAIPHIFLFPPLGTTWVEAAEGETMITVADAQRINTRRNRAQEVCVSRRPRSLRPTIAGVTNVVDRAIRRIYIPATDKSKW